MKIGLANGIMMLAAQPYAKFCQESLGSVSKAPPSMLVQDVPWGAFFRAENKFWGIFFCKSQVVINSGVSF